MWDHILETYGLPVCWLGLLLAGLGVPIPEDIFLISGGAWAKSQEASIFFTIFVLYSGVMVGDAIVYHLGSRYGEAVLKRKFIARLMTPARIERVRSYYGRYGAVTVFLARHVAGIRFPTFLLAGVSKMGFLRFFFWDGLAALISVPLWFWLGYAAYAHREEIQHRVSGWMAWILGAAVLGLIVFKLRHRIFKTAGSPKAPAPAATGFAAKDPVEP